MIGSWSLPGVLLDADTRAGLDWAPFREGIDISWIHGPDAADGPGAAFLRYAPGASVPRHHHSSFEYILVLEGSQIDQQGTHRKGALVVNPPGTEHDVTSPDGCIVLAIWVQPVRFL